MIALHLFVIFVLIAVNAFFAAVEFSLVAVRQSRVRQLVEQGDARARVVEFLIAGANAVQIGTANFRDPSLASRLVGELAAWCEDHGVARVSDLVDTLRTRPRPDHEFA